MEQDSERATHESSYEPPRVERVIQKEDLDREVHYAGRPDPS